MPVVISKVLTIVLIGCLLLLIAQWSLPDHFADRLALHSAQISQAKGVDMSSSQDRRAELTIGSFNIRFDGQSSWPFGTFKMLTSDSAYPARLQAANLTQTWGEERWSNRKYAVVDIPLFHNWDIFAFQEVLHGQLLDLETLLGAEYAYAGVGRNDGVVRGEAVPLFWKRSILEQVSAKEGGVGRGGVQHFWLSTDEEIPGSVGWDADQTRMCTHVSLRLKGDPTRQVIHVFSTHYDHKGVVARAKSSEIILRRAAEAVQQTLKGGHGTPLVLLIGDLNSPRNEKGWQTLVGSNYDGLVGDAASYTFLDTALSVPTRFPSPYLGLSSSASSIPPSNHGGMLSLPNGPLTTFTGFQPSPRADIEDRIDFIFAGKNNVAASDTKMEDDDSSLWRIRTFGVLPAWSQGDAGWQLSDHRPIMARLQRAA